MNSVLDCLFVIYQLGKVMVLKWFYVVFLLVLVSLFLEPDGFFYNPLPENYLSVH